MAEYLGDGWRLFPEEPDQLTELQPVQLPVGVNHGIDHAIPTDTSTIEQPKPKKKRGRPPGVKNKAKNKDNHAPSASLTKQPAAVKSRRPSQGKTQFNNQNDDSTPSSSSTEQLVGVKNNHSSQANTENSNQDNNTPSSSTEQPLSSISFDDDNDSVLSASSAVEVEFTEEIIRYILDWWKDVGKLSMSNCRSNREKSSVWMGCAKSVNSRFKKTFTGDQVKNKFHNIRTGYKSALRHNSISGNDPSPFPYMEQCGEVFARDYDIHPLTTMSTDDKDESEEDSSVGLVPAKKKRRTSADDTNEFRKELLSVLKTLVEKI